MTTNPKAAPPGTPGAHGASWFAIVIAGLLLLNAAVAFLGLVAARRVHDDLRWTMLRAVPLAAADGGTAGPNVTFASVRVDVFSDMLCRFCRRGAAAIQAVQERYGDRVLWSYWHIVQPVTVEPLSLSAALAAECTSFPEDPWDFLFAAGEDTLFAQEHISRITTSLGVTSDSLARCSEADAIKERVWAEVFQASRIGINRTPTIRVNGTEVVGMPTVEALTKLVEAELARFGSVADSAKE